MKKASFSAFAFRSAVLGSSLLLFATAASAHSIWFAQRAGELALIYGHGAEDLSVIKRLDKISSVGGVDAQGRVVKVVLRATDHLAFVNTENAPAVVTATMDNGLWSQGPDGKWVGKGKDEVPGAKQSGRYLKYSSHLRELPKTELAPVPGLAFQILPRGADFPQTMGLPLKLRVLLNGQPAAGAKVWADSVNDPDAEPVTTAKDGSVTLKVRNQGLNVIRAELDTPPLDPAKSNKTEHSATLSFVLAHIPE
jgi:nickel transport protein